MLIRYVTLRPGSLTRWPWKFVVHQASRHQSLHEIWAKSSNARIDDFAISAHVMSCCDLDFAQISCRLWWRDAWCTTPLTSWPELLRHFDCHVFKLCTKFERNQIFHGWVIDDLARLRRAIIRGGAFLPNGSQGCVNPTSPNLARTYGDHSYRRNCFKIQIIILLHFQTPVAQS